MNIIFHKSLGSRLLVMMFGKQSSECDFCFRKVTQRNLAMIFKDKEGIMRVCCNNIVCLLSAEEMRK
jgi:hypothetical protein